MRGEMDSPRTPGKDGSRMDPSVVGRVSRWNAVDEYDRIWGVGGCLGSRRRLKDWSVVLLLRVPGVGETSKSSRVTMVPGRW